MAVTAETRTSLIGLSVVMLGRAPGTDLLNEWVDAIDDGMSLEDVANHIADSDAFQETYPKFLTPREFAESMLDDLMGGENVSATLVAAAVDIVVGLLNDGMTRGALALAAFGALYDIHKQGAAHPAYGDLGAVADGIANKVAVAEYYTVELRQAGSNSRVLRGVDSDTGLDDVRDGIGDLLDPPEPFVLARGRDDVEGTAANDLILAEPDKNGLDTLESFDVIDGGAGEDTLEIYAGGTSAIEIDGNGADVANVERAHLFTRGAIDVDLTGWEGLETVELGRFGASEDVTVKVDGASVSTSHTFGGHVTIVGVAGEASVNAGKTSAIRIGSGDDTTSVMTKGGATVDVNANGAGGQSATVTRVVIDGVAGEALGGDGKRGNPMEEVVAPVDTGNAALTPSVTVTQYGTNENGTFTPVPDADIAGNTFYEAANQDIDGAATAGTGLDAGQVVVTQEKDEAKIILTKFDSAGKRVAPGAEGYDEATVGTDSGAVPIHVHSDAIEHVSLSNTYATIAVVNQSKEAENLTVTVNKYGSAAVAGKFCVTGDGAAENVTVMVAGDSNFALANDATKTVSVHGDGDLTLAVTDFVGPPTNVDAGGAITPKASTTLESVHLNGGGKFTMNAMGLSKLKTVDASDASGDVTIHKLGKSLADYHGGSASDRIEVSAFADAGVTVDLGAGHDRFASADGNGKSRVDGGDGTDVLHLTGKSATVDDKGKASIFSNFEILDIGGSGTAAHDVKLLGVNSVTASASTVADTDPDAAGMQAAVVTLNNMADGMGIGVDGKAGTGTTATVVHNLAEARRHSGELEVTLTANGSGTDKATMGTGAGRAEPYRACRDRGYRHRVECQRGRQGRGGGLQELADP